MKLSYAQLHDRKVARFLESLTAESEAFGVFGREEHADSFYRLFVRRTPKSTTWWRFESQAGPSGIDPIKHQERLAAKGPCAPSKLVPLGQLARYKHAPKTSLERLFERARELATSS